MSYKEKFIDTVVDHSVANDWNTAKTEWGHVGSYDQPESNCICGQCITEVCTIQNYQNGQELEVGNVCINKFLDIDRKSDFKLIKKNTIDWKLLLELKGEGVITEWEMYFYEDTRRKRKLTDKQLDIRDRVLQKAKDYIMRNKKKIRGINDPILFKNLKTETMNIKQEHRDQLGRFIAQQGMRISKSKHELSFTETFDILKETLIQIKKLKDSYGI